MEYTLTISQKAIADNFPTLDIKDAAIIDFLSRFSASKKIAKKIIGDSIFYWFDYNKIATENPLLKLGSEAIRKRLRELCSLGILEAHPLNSGGRVFFAFGDNFELTHKYEPRENDTDLLRKTSGRKSRPPREENPDLSAKPRENDTDISNIPLDQKNQDQNNQETTPKKKSKPLKEKKEKEKKDVPPALDFSNFDNPEAAEEIFTRWLKYRKDIKHPYKSEDTIQTSLKNLLTYSAGRAALAEQIIEKSIGNGYQGFFKPEIQKNGNSTIQPENRFNRAETIASAQRVAESMREYWQ